jgi:hypothetical protein
MVNANEGEVVLTIPKCILILYENHTSRIIDNGDMELIFLESRNKVCLSLGKWLYALDMNIPVATNAVDKNFSIGKKYFFPGDHQTYCVVLGDIIDVGTQDALEGIIGENAMLYFPKAPNNLLNSCIIGMVRGPEGETFSSESSGPRMEGDKTGMYQKGMDPRDASKGIGHYLSVGGDLIQEGLSKGGSWLGGQIAKGGKWVTS